MNNEIFVFASNTGGVHGAGSAKTARDSFDAKWGIGVGPTGRAYAIPTKRHLGYTNGKHQFEILSIQEIEPYVKQFIEYSTQHPDLIFNVVKIGCGLSGYTEEQMSPLFKNCPNNVNLPFGWR